MGDYRLERAGEEHALTVATMVAALLHELSGGTQQPDIAVLQTVAQARLRNRAEFVAYLAFDRGQDVVGVITVSAGTAIYAGGSLGTIQELYVAPAHRSATVGQLLLTAALDAGRAAGWNRIEVGAPSAARWQRTINFYKANGFAEIGPRLQRRLVS
jgi:GNAT superfamily N-acetyltransferase